MCGRYSFTLSPKKIKEKLDNIQVPDQLEMNYNVAPTQTGYVITNKHPDVLEPMRWGLIPFWAKPGQRLPTLINARSESVTEKASFRQPVQQRRCLVLADSFYEWKREGKSKQPYRILPADGDYMVMAGIYETWTKGEDGTVRSYTILTTTPNAEMEPIHDRMPVLLSSLEARELWLADGPAEDRLDLLRPAADGSLIMYPVSTQLGNVRNNGPHLHEPLGKQGELFE